VRNPLLYPEESPFIEVNAAGADPDWKPVYIEGLAEQITEHAKAHPEIVGKFIVTDGEGNVLAETENTISTIGVNDTITLEPKDRGQELLEEINDWVDGKIYSVEPWTTAQQAEAELASLEAFIMKPGEMTVEELGNLPYTGSAPKAGWDLVTSRPGAVAEPDPKTAKKPKVDRPKLKVHQPEPTPPAPISDEDYVYSDALLAKMFANLEAHGLKPEDLAG
jgi:hypothetical protein